MSKIYPQLFILIRKKCIFCAIDGLPGTKDLLDVLRISEYNRRDIPKIK